MKTLDELKTLCDNLRDNGKYPFELGNKLGESPYLDYHYSFIYGDDDFLRKQLTFFAPGSERTAIGAVESFPFHVGVGCPSAVFAFYRLQ